jgi:uncharacterized protein (TIGR02328 family)
MRLWHKDLIPVLPRQQLLGQHREICGLRGNAWGKKHSTINYIFNHDYEYLYNFHMTVIKEMKRRNYKPNPIWTDFNYRGKSCSPIDRSIILQTGRETSYPEHDNNYLKGCISNLKTKLEKAKVGKYNENDVYRFYTFIQDLS